MPNIGIKHIGKNRIFKNYTYSSKADKTISLTYQQGGQTMFANTTADICIYGGSAGCGKSHALLMSCADPKKIKVSGYNAVIFRRSFPEINNPGGLVDESRKIYPEIGGIFKSTFSDWVFPQGSKISFRHIQYEKTVHDYQGSQICNLCFDELTHFSSKTFFYMLSRNRSACGIKPTIKATCNPDADSWVAELIAWWIDQDTGLPIKERRGVIRYFVRLEEEIFWGDSREELIKKYDVEPKSLTFIYGTVQENQKLLDKNPDYISNLKALHPVERERLLYGNWKIRLEAGVIFDGNWFKKIKRSQLPKKDGVKVRFWDIAGTSKDTKMSNSQMDKVFYTASMLIEKIDEEYFIIDCEWERVKAGQIQAWIRKTAKKDGIDTRIRWELEGGGAGRIFADELRAALLEDNPEYDVEAIKPQGDKVTRALKLATAASRGEVYILDTTWTREVINCFQSFDGTRKPLVNDVTDAGSGAYNELENVIDYDFSNCFSSQDKLDDRTRFSSINPSSDYGSRRVRW
jgi:predicted phage terminase large subunit-like protein